MPVRTAEAEWKGNLAQGAGQMKTGSGAVERAYSFSSRFEDGAGTNPEELIGAAHAGCFSMALAHALAQAGHEPERVRTTASVHLEKTDDGMSITRIDLVTRGRVPGIDQGTFEEYAENARKGCIVSRALRAVEISVDATLES
jgi:osmotically inducible protein OsmC